MATDDWLAPYVPQIKKIEGFTPRAKWDYKQHSIGYGTRGQPGQSITPDQAEADLRRELASAAGHVDRFAPGLPTGHRAALTSLTFNSGPGWQSKGLGAAVKAGDWQTAAQRFSQYNKVTNPDGSMTVLPGLARRRATELSWMGQAMPASAAAPSIVPRLKDPGVRAQAAPIAPEMMPQVLPTDKSIDTARDMGMLYMTRKQQPVTQAGAAGWMQALANVANAWTGRQWMEQARADEGKREGANVAALRAMMQPVGDTPSPAATPYTSAAPALVERSSMPDPTQTAAIVPPMGTASQPMPAIAGGETPIMPALASARPQIGAGYLPDESPQSPVSRNMIDMTGEAAPQPMPGQSGAMPRTWNAQPAGIGAREPVIDLAEGETPYQFAADQGIMPAGLGSRDRRVPGTEVGGQGGQVRNDARAMFDEPAAAQATGRAPIAPQPRQPVFDAGDVRRRADEAVQQHQSFVRAEMGRLRPMLSAPAYRAQAMEQMQRLRGQLSPNVLSEIRKSTILSERELAKATDNSRVMEVGGKLVRVNPDNTVTELYGTDPVAQRLQQIKSSGLDPNAQANKVYIATGKMPREDQNPLTATDKKAIGEADDQVIAAQNVMSLLDEAAKLNPQANAGPLAGTRAAIGNALPDFMVPDVVSSPESSKATSNFSNILMGQALAQLKSTFGAAPTEGERKILMDLQGSLNEPVGVRNDILRRARALAEKRLREQTDRASALRGGEYYKPGQGPSSARPSTGALDEARAAISRGAPRDKVIERLRQNGIDPAGL